VAFGSAAGGIHDPPRPQQYVFQDLEKAWRSFLVKNTVWHWDIGPAQKRKSLFAIGRFPARRIGFKRVDFGSGQGRSDLDTAGVAALRRGCRESENAGLDRKMPF
jgi:hypothetical protein